MLPALQPIPSSHSRIDNWLEMTKQLSPELGFDHAQRRGVRNDARQCEAGTGKSERNSFFRALASARPGQHEQIDHLVEVLHIVRRHEAFEEDHAAGTVAKGRADVPQNDERQFSMIELGGCRSIRLEFRWTHGPKKIPRS